MLVRAAPTLLLLFCLLAMAGCDPAKRVPAGRHLLVKATAKERANQVNQGDLSTLMKQRPNKRILGVRFYLAVYNFPDPGSIARKKARKLERNEVNNQRRIAKGRQPKEVGRTTGEWMREVVGEAPVVFDSALTDRTREQMLLYLLREGYFEARVTDTVEFRGRKAHVTYYVDAGEPYLLDTVTYTVDHGGIHEYVERTWEGSLLKPGDRFRAEHLDAERDRITGILKGLGYLYFTREQVSYDADTAVGDRKVKLAMRITRAPGRPPGPLWGTPEGTIFYLDKMTVDASLSTRTGTVMPDALVHEGIAFLYRGRKPAYRPQALETALFVHPGDRFDQRMSDLTYKRLTNLRVFDRVDMVYDTVGIAAHDRVNCTVRLLPASQQSLSAEGFATNRGGFLGTSISLSYRHRNLFRSMGSVQAQLTLGLEAQQSFTGETTNAGDGNPLLGRGALFNTIEIGPEITFRFPQFLLPINRKRFARASAPRTTLGLLYNYQRRPDYNRTLAKLSFGYEWNESRTKTWTLNPVEVNVIRIPYRSPEFQEYLVQTNDPVLIDSYTDHLILGNRLMFTFNTQDKIKKRDDFFVRTYLESSGNLMRLIGNTFSLPQTTDTAGNTFYTLTGVRFAQFLKVDADLRYYRRIHEKSSLAFRMAGGVGIPLNNLGVLPFETSYFVGGANGLRAWRARSVGPGSYPGELVAFDRIGEIRIEANAEYRFNLIGFVELALFADAANIWLLHEDERRPGSGFGSDFLSELAIGTGLGLRLNFEFFLVRFDLGMKTKDPSYASGSRWLFERGAKDRTLSQLLNLNLGIGYPF
ncbi:MAG: BamA/TamA family outer membrane protein [Flavobacteriales bacterium]|nr:BamA/TamA family outer membrane protein [Flavobacteriales bacterium]